MEQEIKEYIRAESSFAFSFVFQETSFGQRRKAMWPPRPGDEGYTYDGSGFTDQKDPNLDSTTANRLSDALEKPIKVLANLPGGWYGGIGGPQPGKRSAARNMFIHLARNTKRERDE